MSTNSTHKYILTSVTLAVLILGMLLFISPAAIFPDPSWGFQVMRSMQSGGGFNQLITPDHKDIAKNTTSFLSWWSPGQYLLPYLFIKLTGANVGYATAITITLCQFIGLVGFYFFFRKAGFNPLVSALSLVFIVCQQAFFSPYIFYTGGETLLFAFLGWFLYGCLALDKPNFKLVIFVLLSGWLGFICKSSFIWMYAAALLFIWIRLCRGDKNVVNWILKGLWPGIPALLSVAVIYVFYLSKGGNPSSDSHGFKLSFDALAFPLASPILSGFSADDLVNGLLYHNDAAIMSPAISYILLGLFAVLSVGLIYAIWQWVPNNAYKLLLILFYTISIIFFGSAYLRQVDISYEARHFRIIGLMITPGVLYLLGQIKFGYRLAFAALAVFIAFFSFRFYSLSYIALGTETARGPSGIAQQFIDQPSLDYITMLDKKSKDAIFVLLSPDLRLEIQHNRVITMEALNKDISFNFDESVYKGHAGPVYILMPSDYIGIRANVLLKCFPGYKGFSLKELSDDYVLYFATEAR
jgi:hypothetical protein